MATSKPQPPAAFEKHALKALAKQEQVEDLLIVGREEAAVPSTGAGLFRFHAVEGNEPNGPHYSVVLDDKRQVVDLARLSEKEGAELFGPPDFSPLLEAEAEDREPFTIEPEVNKLVLEECRKIDEVIKVTVPKNVGVSKADVYFLADTTGSMRPFLEAVKDGANAIVNAPVWAGRDVAFGVGQYQDFPIVDFAFQHQQDPDTNPANATAAIGAWTEAAGGDGSEGQFYALDQLAEAPGGTIGWRPDAKRIIVWFGDAPGHDPICNAISSAGYDITEASATAKLAAEGITVLALSTVSTFYPDGLNDDPQKSVYNYSGTCAIGGSSGQANRITAATGGVHVAGIDADNIVNKIITLLDTAVNTINNVKLVATGATAPFVTSISPANGYGPLAGDKEHVLEFEVRFTGIYPCGRKDRTFAGSLEVVADGSVEARKRVFIRVPACKHSYSVKFVCGKQEYDRCGDKSCGPVRPGTYATEINIHNYHGCEVKVEKFVLPLVVEDQPVGREPRWVGRKAKDRIVLPPNTATFDDCHRIWELLHRSEPPCPTPLMIGFLEIVSDRELKVTAVYTATGRGSKRTSIDVEQIEGKLK